MYLPLLLLGRFCVITWPNDTPNAMRTGGHVKIAFLPSLFPGDLEGHVEASSSETYIAPRRHHHLPVRGKPTLSWAGSTDICILLFVLHDLACLDQTLIKAEQT